MSREENAPLVSVIVPVYKAENYLHKCVDSLLAQTFTDFEIILVNDGSPDRSGEICDEYAKKDSRIRVIHKENGGVSSARQCGIDNAQGEYTIHADPDDWVECDMLEELYCKAKEEDADMVICDYYVEYKNLTKYIKQQPSALDHKTVLCELFQQLLHGSCWNKLVRRVCYNNHNIKFPENINRWEDLFVNCDLLYSGIRVNYLPKAFYHYDNYSNPNSIVRKISIEGVKSQIHFVNYFANKLDSKIHSEELYKVKAATKELAFMSGLFKKEEIIQLYAEINERYCALNKTKHIVSISKILSYAITHQQWYDLMYLYFAFIQTIKSVIRPLFR